MNEQPAPSLPPNRRPPASEIFTPGILAGLAGAVIMGLLAMIVSAAMSMGFFTPMKLIAGTFLGSRVLEVAGSAAAGTVILGIGIHLVLGAFFGVLYAWWLPRKVSGGTEFWMSLLYGAGLFVVMAWLVMPWADPVMFAHVNKGWLFLYNLVYGVSLALVLPIRREVRGTPMRREAHTAA